MAKQATCDVCGRGQALRSFGLLPEGWVTVTEHRSGPDSTAELCGLGCVETFARQELNARQARDDRAKLELERAGLLGNLGRLHLAGADE
jgi:hypothetical protein